RSHSPLVVLRSFFFIPTPHPPRSTLFPYTTLFRSFGAMVSMDIEDDAGLHVTSPPYDRRQQTQANCRRTTDSQVPRRVVFDILGDRKSTRLNSSHVKISYAVFCLKKKN